MRPRSQMAGSDSGLFAATIPGSLSRGLSIVWYLVYQRQEEKLHNGSITTCQHALFISNDEYHIGLWLPPKPLSISQARDCWLDEPYNSPCVLSVSTWQATWPNNPNNTSANISHTVWALLATFLLRLTPPRTTQQPLQVNIRTLQLSWSSSFYLEIYYLIEKLNNIQQNQ